MMLCWFLPCSGVHQPYTRPRLNLPPTPSPSHPSAWSRSAGRSSPGHTQLPSCATCGDACVPMPFSQPVSPSPSPTVSTRLDSESAAPCLPLQIGSAEKVSRFHICVNVQYFSLSDSLPLCTTGRRFIRLTKTDSNVLLFMAE